MFSSLYQFLPFILTAAVVIFLIGVILVIMRFLKKKDKAEEVFISHLHMATTGLILKTKNDSILDKYINFWDSKLKGADLVSKESKPSKNSMIVTVGILGIYSLTGLFLQDPFIGLIPTALGIIVFVNFINKKENSKKSRTDEQIPFFVSALKSNIQSNTGPENSLINAIENTQSPLYDELLIAKSLIETGTFSSALRTLKSNSKNKSLKFLCSCIELSAEVGANLEEQIEVIEEIMVEKKALDRKYESAMSQNKPLIMVAVSLIPGLFLYMYLTSPQAREFWFRSTLSWIILAVIVALAIIAVVAAKAIIKNAIKNI